MATTRGKFLVPLLVLGLVGAACGGDDDDTPSGDGDTISSEPDGDGSEGSSPPDEPTDGGETTDPPSAGDTTVPAEQPEPAGEYDREATLRISFPSTTDSIDPHTTRSPFYFMVNPFYDSLFFIDGQNGLNPGVAESYETSEDGLTLTLRDDVVFSDGTPLTADAVVASLERARTFEGSLYGAQFTNVTTIAAVDDYTVELGLESPDSTLPYRLAGNAGLIINPVALEAGVDLSTTPSGSAPYDLVSFDPGVSLIVERRDGAEYWDPDAWTPKRIEIYGVGDPNAISNGFITGQFDVARYSSGWSAAREELGEDAGNWVGIDSDGLISLRVQPTATLNTPELRRAVWQAIDIESIMASGLVTDVDYNDQLLRPGRPGHLEDYESPYAYDPEAARAVFEEAGLTSFEVLVASTQANEMRIAEFMVPHFQENYGIEVVVTPLTVGEAAATFRAGDRDTLLQGTSSQPDFALTVLDVFISQSGDLAGPNRAAWDEAINAANALPLGSPERTEALEELSRVVLADHVALPIGNHINGYVTTDKVIGVDDTMGYGNHGVMDARKIHIIAG